MRGLKKSILWTLAALLAVGTPMVAGAAGFPEYAETEYEQSIITIPIFAGEDMENPVEILKLTAFMRLERELPKRNGLGHRQIEFTIADWELYGYSEFLDADITFKLSDVPVQPKSLVISLTEENDYPAMIIYNAIYDIYIGQKRVAKNKPGVAFAKNVYEIPPRNISVAFSKPFRGPEEDVKPGALDNTAAGAGVGGENNAGEPPFPTGPCPYTGCWDPGTCEDMFQITKAEFDDGVAISKAIRAGKMTLKGQ
ncbi:MAG: hypothetical protein AAF604_01625 [Acidobacteriota bacterium]